MILARNDDKSMFALEVGTHPLDARSGSALFNSKKIEQIAKMLAMLLLTSVSSKAFRSFVLAVEGMAGS